MNELHNLVMDYIYNNDLSDCDLTFSSDYVKIEKKITIDRYCILERMDFIEKIRNLGYEISYTFDGYLIPRYIDNFDYEGNFVLIIEKRF